MFVLSSSYEAYAALLARLLGERVRAASLQAKYVSVPFQAALLAKAEAGASAPGLVS